MLNLSCQLSMDFSRGRRAFRGNDGISGNT
jgi:hypothetical protein